MNELISKLAKIQSELGTFQPDKTNTQQRYDYISADQVLSRVGAVMAKHGVMIIPAISEECVETITYLNNRGQESSRYDAMVAFEMTVTDGADKLVQQWVGRGSDYSVPDKATYKAITSGHKYFEMKLFNIGIGNEDGEHEPPEPEPPRQQPQRQAPKAPPPPQSPPAPPLDGTTVDSAAWLEAEAHNGKVSVFQLKEALMMTGLYNNAFHAFSTIKIYDGYPEGYDVERLNDNSTILLDSALKILDWAIDRKVTE